MKKILKIIGIIVLIVLLLAFIYYIRNLIIINKLAKAHEAFFLSDNYSYTMQVDSGEGPGMFKYYHKDGKIVEVMEFDKNTLFKTWCDMNTKEKISCVQNSNNLTATVDCYQEDSLIFMKNGISGWLKNRTPLEKMRLALMFFIDTETINGEECYRLNPIYGVASNTYFFNKQTGNAVRCTMSFGASKIDFMDWKLNEVTDEDVKKPDLTNYDVTYY